jgi:flagellin-like protein
MHRFNKRRAVSGIIAAVMLFAMLFSVGTSYFLFVNQNNLLYNQAASNRNSAVQSALSEDALLTAAANPSTSVISFTIDNTGGVLINASAFFVTDNTGTVVAYCKHSLSGTVGTCPPLPVAVGVGSSSVSISTGVVYSSTKSYTISVVTQSGNVFTATYPPTATSLAAQALSSGAIGDLYLAFQSYHYYHVTSGSGCPSGTPYSGYCVTNLGKAFAISHSLMSSGYDIAFSVTITNFNQEGNNIVLDPYTLMTLVPESGRGSLSYIPWFIVSNKSTGGFNAILSSYTPIVLQYNTPVTVVFASATALAGVGFAGGDLEAVGNIAAGTTTPIFMVSHGCEAPAITTCEVSSANYGQNSPYVTTLFY